MNIGQAADASGVSTKMIRYYEKTGLIKSADRTNAGYRVYEQRDVHTLRFIRRARDLGFSVEEIKGLLALWQDRARSNSNVKALALAHVARLSGKILHLQSLVATLSDLAASCADDERPDCPILRDLADGRQNDLAGAPDSRFGPTRIE